jgi:hypothetical protein
VNLQVTFFLTEAEVAANEAIERGLRFIRDDGRVDIPAVLAEYTRRLDAYPIRDGSEIACDLNYEVSREQAEWSRQVNAQAREANERERMS